MVREVDEGETERIEEYKQIEWQDKKKILLDGGVKDIEWDKERIRTWRQRTKQTKSENITMVLRPPFLLLP